MDVAAQNSLPPASKIIYVTPQTKSCLGISKRVQQLLLNRGRPDVCVESVKDTRFCEQNGRDTTCSTIFATELQNKVNTKTARSLKSEKNSWKAYQGYSRETTDAATVTNSNCDTRNHSGQVFTKSVAGTQTNLNNQGGRTIFDEMRQKAEAAFTKLDQYQTVLSEEKDGRKSVLLPGTDSEYRTPGAHYRNKNGQIKRPMNAFMVWAREFRGKLAAAMPNATNSDISIKLGQIWSSLPPEQKRQYYNIAEKIKLKHRQDFPDWVYKPIPTIKKRDGPQIQQSPPVHDSFMTSIRQHVPAPTMPFVNLMTDVNNNQTAACSNTRIPVILQPVTYQYGCPTISRTVKEKLVDKISGTPNRTGHGKPSGLLTSTCKPVNTNVQIIESAVGCERQPLACVIERSSGERQGQREQHVQQITPRPIQPLTTPKVCEDQPVAPKPVKPDVSDIKPPVIPLERESKILMREPVQETKSKPGEGQKISKGTRKEMEKEQADCFVTDDKVSDRAGLNPTNMKYGSTIFADLESSGSSRTPMYLELLDPFDPLMDCDFLYSELYPGCLHLDVTRWREYLDISSDNENDPLSRFQDDSDEDIKISPVPLKESLRRLCNAHVQKSASSSVINGDVIVPIMDLSRRSETDQLSDDSVSTQS